MRRVFWLYEIIQLFQRISRVLKYFSIITIVNNWIPIFDLDLNIMTLILEDWLDEDTYEWGYNMGYKHGKAEIEWKNEM